MGKVDGNRFVVEVVDAHEPREDPLAVSIFLFGLVGVQLVLFQGRFGGGARFKAGLLRRQ